MKRFYYGVSAVFAAVTMSASVSEARVLVHIDLSSQRMSVQSSSGSYVWPVSTARSGYYTPRGSYAPTSLQRMHYSKKYHNSPMPYSIFFRGGYAIHGTYATGALGRPASHGCVRLAPGNAAALFQMVQREGASISISGSPPGGHQYARAGKHRVHYASSHRWKQRYAAAQHRRNALGYAPIQYRRAPTIQLWQLNPTGY